MRTAQPGDRVYVHYVKRFADGSTASSRGRPPLEMTVGTYHPRLPGLGASLVGLAAGQSTRLTIPAERAYGLHNPTRVRRLDRRCFRPGRVLAAGQWVRVLGRGGRRLVRVVEAGDAVVTVDVNHPRAGQDLELEVELVGFQTADAGGTPVGEPQPCRLVALDVDPPSLRSLRRAFPTWQVEARDGATSGSLARDWNPGPADLLVVGAHDEAAETLALCRGLRSQAGRAVTPLLVLLAPAQRAVAKAALEAGATNCLVLPVFAPDLVAMVARARKGNQPGRHTLDLDRAQRDDPWRDNGGGG